MAGTEALLDDVVMPGAAVAARHAPAGQHQHHLGHQHQHDDDDGDNTHLHVDIDGNSENPQITGAGALASTLPPTESSPGAPTRPLPTTFPKKRRGRPPGRPNATVRDADYEENPLVRAWNAAKNDRAVPVVAITIRDALTEQSLVHETQRAIFRFPSRETILFVQGWITAKHIASQRPSYVNGLLIHSRGQDAAVSCAQCTEKRAKHALGPFLTCRVLPGSYHNSCSNCKWFDNTSTCSLYTGPKPNRKRKAKEQLPPPPAPGVASPLNPEGGDGQERPLSEEQSLIHPDLQRPPEADMGLTQQDEHDQEQLPTVTPQTNLADMNENDPSAGLHPDGEANASDMPEVPSQPDSLSESHFVLSKPGPDEDLHEAEDGDDGEYVQKHFPPSRGRADFNSSFVDAQLAAQLLPEIEGQDS